jgi:hypothetical protein
MRMCSLVPLRAMNSRELGSTSRASRNFFRTDSYWIAICVVERS